MKIAKQQGLDAKLADMASAFHSEYKRHRLSDRAAVIISGAFLDAMLEELLSAGLADVRWKKALFEGQGALATFSARIDIACATGLISESMRRDLHLVRRIRNHFAHRVVGGSLEEKPVCQWIEATSVHRFVADAAASRGRTAAHPASFRDSIHILVGFLQACIGRAQRPRVFNFDLGRIRDQEAISDRAARSRPK